MNERCGERARAPFAFVLALLCACESSDREPAAEAQRDGATAVPGDRDAAAAAAATDAAAAAAALDADELPTLTAELRAKLALLRYDGAPPPADPSNRFADDPAARAFGQRLFFEPALSGPLIEGDNDGGAATLGRAGEAGRISCAGCHLPNDAFTDTRSPHRQISLAARWTTRRSPSLLEAGFAPLLNWDGRHDSLWSQALGVMESDAEFNSGRLFVALQMWRLHRREYEAVFGALPPLDDASRFPQLNPDEAGCRERMTRAGVVYDCRGKPGDGADYDGMSAADRLAVTEVAVNAAKALAAYVRQLRCGPGRFDAWLDGDERPLDASEQRGAVLFVGRARCGECHGGGNLSDGEFHNVGLSPAPVAVAFVDAGDRGAAAGIAAAFADPFNTRGRHSDGDRGVLPASVAELGPELEGAFRTPSLRCVSARPSFMHTGQLRSLEQVIAFFDRGGDPAGHYPGRSELEPLALSARDRADLLAFLATLDGPGPDAALRVAPDRAGGSGSE